MLLADLVKTAAMKIEQVRDRAELAVLQSQFPPASCRRREARSAFMIVGITMAVAFWIRRH
jgi:hypothetical protein